MFESVHKGFDVAGYVAQLLPGAAAGARRGHHDAALALAHHVGGDVSRFVSLMNDEASRLGLGLRLGGGTYELAAGQGDALVEVTSDESSIAHRVERRGDLARVTLSTDVGSWWGSWPSDHHWRIAVAPGIPTVIDVQAGAGRFDIDLSSLAVVSGFLGIGAASLALTLPVPRGEVPIRIEGGAASFTVRIPAGVEARVTTTGLVMTDGPSETAGYGRAADRVTVTVTGGAASVRVVQG